jgi:hypothetical protein
LVETEKLGFSRKGKTFTWEINWHLTDSGVQMAATCHAEFLARIKD